MLTIYPNLSLNNKGLNEFSQKLVGENGLFFHRKYANPLPNFTILTQNSEVNIS